MTPSHGPSLRRSGTLMWISALLLCATTLRAQQIDLSQFPAQPLPDTAAHLIPAYGFNDDDFSIGAYVFPGIGPNGRADSVWPWMRSMGIRIGEIRIFFQYRPEAFVFDTLADGLVPRDASGHWNERLIVSTPPWDRIGNGHQATFFPFDSSESHYWPSLFLGRIGGRTMANLTQLLGGRDSMYERVYDTSSTGVNATVLSHIVIGYDSVYQKERWRASTGDSVEVHGDIFRKQRFDTYLSKQTLYVVLTGHLFDTLSPLFVGPIAHGSDTLLAVELWNEMPMGTSYLNASGTQVTAANDTSMLYTTIYVRKDSLSPVGASPNFDAYRELAYPVNMVRASPTGPGGPWNSANSAARFDVHVRWTGREMLALRSITLRDSTCQLAFGQDAAGNAFRSHLDSAIEYLMRGRDHSRPDSIEIATDFSKPVRLGRIIRLYTGDEGYYNEQTGYNFLDSFAYRRYSDTALHGNDTLERGVRAWRAEAYTNPQQYLMSSQQEISIESYPFANSVTTALYADSTNGLHVTRFGLPQNMWSIPSIAAHNGGRMHIPLLNLQAGRASDRDSVERYARVWNRLGLGVNIDISAHRNWPYDDTPLGRLGPAAWASRRTGRRLIQWPGVQHTMDIRWLPDNPSHPASYTRDTNYTHMIEPSELRCLINIGLAYGSRGIHYSQLGMLPHSYGDAVARDTFGNLGHNYNGEFSPVGNSYNDTLDSYTSVALTSPVWMSPPQNDTLKQFWTGWGVNRKEMRWLNLTWLPAIDSELRKIHWRDAYTVHYIEPQTYWDATSHVPTSRSLPSTEIVTRVEALDRWGRKDSAMNTFAELAFFDKSLGRNPDGSLNPLNDTNHIFVVNRRTFERTGDIPDTSTLGKHLDSLAEVRTITLKLHLHHPDTTQYNFVHVWEVAPDTTPLPLAQTARQPLDTILREDSTIALTLRPGGAALLRMTYCKPNEVVFTGSLLMNNQRKMVFDGTFWHAVYVRRTKFRAPPLKRVQDSVWSDEVYYRRSLPITNDMGAIRWDPQAGAEVIVSDTTHDRHYLENRFPSLTVRADSTKLSDRVVTVVWSSYNNVGSGFARPILTTNIYYPAGNLNALPTVSSVIDSIGVALGVDDGQWGTPVVSRLHGAYLYAFSDSVRGIVSVVRKLVPSTQWWDTTGIYRTCDTVSQPFLWMGAGKYPTMPPFAHIAGRDSSIGIAWQQPITGGSGGTQWTGIFYARLVDTVNGGGQHRVLVKNRMMVSQNDGINNHRHPSMDMTQDVWYGAQEGITWESTTYGLSGSSFTSLPNVHFSSLWTETSRACTPGGWRPYFDCIEAPFQWTYNTTIAATLPIGTSADVYPSTSSINARMTPHDDSTQTKITFSVLMSPIVGFTPMQQSVVEYATSFIWGSPESYLIGGFNPNGSASLTKQQGKHAALFVESNAAATQGQIETSRQFFAKERPLGYMAQGRRVYFRISDSVPTAICGMMIDAWAAGPSGTIGLEMAARADSMRRTDSLPMVASLMRTKYFGAHDSTTIGCEFQGRFAGDTGLAHGMRVQFIAELVDSATDQAVARLDSFEISPTADSVATVITRDVDLLSGTYYIRLRIEPLDVVVENVLVAPLYPVEEITMPVQNVAAKLRLVERGASLLRVTAYPNPMHAGGELRISVPGTDRVTLTVYDADGREVRRLVDGAMIEEGRYAIDLDTHSLAPGTYLVELKSGRSRAVAKMVVMR